MGTEIQVKSNLFGHYSMRDLNDNSNLCIWPPYPGDSMLPNGHYYNGFLPRASAVVYPGYGKDMVKQTVLEHEAIFRKQVVELHRLYTKQKELMSEFKRKEMFKGRMPVETSLASSPLASQLTREDVTKWQSPGIPQGNSSYFRSFALGLEGIQSPASSTRMDCTQAADVLSPNGFGIKSLEVLESPRPSKVRKRMIDLQLPADEYIDEDEQEVKDNKFAEELATPLKSYAGIRSVTDLNKPLEIDEADASGYDPQGHSLARSSNLGNSNGISSSHSVVDNDGRGWLSILGAGDVKGKISVPLDVRLQKSHISTVVATEQCRLGHSGGRRVYGVDAVESDNCPEPVVSSRLPSHYQFGSPSEVAKSRSKSVANFEWQGGCSFSQKMPSQNGPSLEATSSSYARVPNPGANEGASGEKQRSQSELPYQNGIYPGPSTSGPHGPPGQHRFIVFDEKHPQLSSSVGMSAARQVNLNPSALLSCPGSVVKAKKVEDHPNILPWKSPETSFHNEVAARTDFNSSESGTVRSSATYTLNSFTPGSSAYLPWEPSGQIRFYTSCVDNVQNRNYEKHSWLSSTSSRSAAEQVDLNAAPLNTPSSGLVIKDKIPDHHPKIPPWLKPETVSRNGSAIRAGPACAESRSIHSFASRDLIRKDEAGRGLEGNKKLSLCIPSISCFGRTVANGNDRGHCLSNRKILGFQIDSKSSAPQTDSCFRNSASVPFSCASEEAVSDYDRKTRLLDINLPCDSVSESAKPSSARSLVVEKGNRANVGHQIDLNLIVGEGEAFAMTSVPSTMKKRIPEIDLEAPAVPDELTCGPRIMEEIGRKSFVDEGSTFAAEAIVSISSSTLEDGFSLDLISRFAGSMEDPLNWFADLVVLFSNDTELRSGATLQKCGRSRMQEEESTSEEMDDFESMTLKLAETKSEDYLPKPFIPEIPQEDETPANQVSSRPRRGQARRGRQRRDFQRDILPGLASLSRQEVTEDLQTFGGLMRATGHAWQAGLTRRNSRNGGGRGRRRNTINTVSQNTLTYCLPPLEQQSSTVEAVGVEERSLTSWGKTTRRPRRQRCPAGNHPPSSIPMMQL